MLNELIRAPFSKELVDKLNTFQEDMDNCIYTCHKQTIGCPYFKKDELGGILSAFEEGLLCECGLYKQEWVLEL